MHGPVLSEIRSRIGVSARVGWNVVVDLVRGAQRVDRIDERRHHRVADRLDDRAAVLRDDREHLVEVPLDLDERGRVAARGVERGRADDVGEQQRLLADAEPDVGADVLLGEQIAELLEAEQLAGAQRVVAPRRLLDREQLGLGRASLTSSIVADRARP